MGPGQSSLRVWLSWPRPRCLGFHCIALKQAGWRAVMAVDTIDCHRAWPSPRLALHPSQGRKESRRAPSPGPFQPLPEREPATSGLAEGGKSGHVARPPSGMHDSSFSRQQQPHHRYISQLTTHGRHSHTAQSRSQSQGRCLCVDRGAEGANSRRLNARQAPPMILTCVDHCTVQRVPVAPSTTAL